MTKGKKFKKRARAKAEAEGVPYTEARESLVEDRGYVKAKDALEAKRWTGESLIEYFVEGMLLARGSGLLSEQYYFFRKLHAMFPIPEMRTSRDLLHTKGWECLGALPKLPVAGVLAAMSKTERQRLHEERAKQKETDEVRLREVLTHYVAVHKESVVVRKEDRMLLWPPKGLKKDQGPWWAESWELPPGWKPSDDQAWFFDETECVSTAEEDRELETGWNQCDDELLAEVAQAFRTPDEYGEKDLSKWKKPGADYKDPWHAEGAPRPFKLLPEKEK